MKAESTSANSIFMLVYTSRTVMPITPELRHDILTISRKHNARDEITGFLTARKRHFLQLLEGPENKVRECYQRILADKRHTLITLQGEALAKERLMPDWKMAWVEENDSTEDMLQLFELGRQGRKYSDPTALSTLVRMFSRNATIIP